MNQMITQKIVQKLRYLHSLTQLNSVYTLRIATMTSCIYAHVVTSLASCLIYGKRFRQTDRQTDGRTTTYSERERDTPIYRGCNMARITVRTPFNVYYSVYSSPESTSLLIDVVIVRKQPVSECSEHNTLLGPCCHRSYTTADNQLASNCLFFSGNINQNKYTTAVFDCTVNYSWKTRQ